MNIIKPKVFDKENPNVSVILPIFLGEKNPSCSRLLAELEKQSFQDFEVIVVAGVSPNGRARNEGVKKASGRILVFIDEFSSLPNETVLENLLVPFDSSERIGMSGVSVLLHPDCSSMQRQYAMIRGVEVPVVHEITLSDKAQHPCMAIPKSVYERVGWESDRLITGTDNDLRQRVAASGYSIVLVPETWVYHTPTPTLKGMLKKSFRKGRGSAYAFLKHPGLFELGRLWGKPVQNRFVGLLYRVISAVSKILNLKYLRNPIAILNQWVITLGFIAGWFRWVWVSPCDERTDLPTHKPPMKILFFSVVELDIPGGPTVHTLNMVKGFREIGAAIRLICPKPEGRTVEIPEIPCRFIRFYGFEWFWLRLFYLKAFLRILWEIIRDKPDVLYIREMQGNVFPALAALFMRIPLVVEVNGPLKGKGWRRFQYAVAKGIIFNSAGLREKVCGDFRIDKEKTEIVTMYVDTHRFCPMPKEKCRSQLGIFQDCLVIGYAGTFQPSHEIEILLPVAEWFMHRKERVEFIFLGKGHQFEKIQKRVQSKGLEKYVRLTGWVPHEEVPVYINSFDVAVNLTKAGKVYQIESLLKLKEYIACGIPVVVNDCDQLLFEEYPHGLLAFSSLDDPEKLGMTFLEKSRQHTDQMITSGVEFIKQKYSLKHGAIKTIELIERVL